MRRAVVTVALAGSLVLSFPVAAVAQTWVEGGGARAFSTASVSDVAVGRVRGADGVVLRRRPVWEFRRPGQEPYEPFSAVRLANGNTLIASRTNEVLEVTPAKKIAWSYTRLADNPTLVNAYYAQRLANGNTLITDRRADYVIEVTSAKKTVWRYGAAADSLQPGSLYDPFCAERLPNGNTLIVDNRGGTRVIEVRSSDYDAAAENLGYDENSIVWSYGIDGSGGIGPGQLASPRHAQRLANGNTLITDSGDQNFLGNRVIEVTPAGDIVWQFGVAGETGADSTHLDRPSAARRLANGNTLIAEEDGQRLLEVDPAGAVVDVCGPGEMPVDDRLIGKLRSVDRTRSGTTLLSDQQNERVIEIGYPLKGSFTSDKLWLGLPGVAKIVSRIEPVAELPPGTSLTVAYSLDGGTWKTLKANGLLPSGARATQLRYRLSLASTSAAYTPVIRQVSITYDVAPVVLGEPEKTNTGIGATATGTSGTRAAGAGSTGSGASAGGGSTAAQGTTLGGGGGTDNADGAAGSGGGTAAAAALAGGGVIARGTLLQSTTLETSGDLPGSGSGSGGSGPAAGGRWFAYLTLAYLAGMAGNAMVGAAHVGAIAPAGTGRR